MKITKELKNKKVTLNISGCMTADNIRPVRQTFENCLSMKLELIILNLEDVRMIDSSGIGAIAFAVKRLRPKGDMKIVGVHGHVAKTLRLVRLDKAIDFYLSGNHENIYQTSKITGGYRFGLANSWI